MDNEMMTDLQLIRQYIMNLSVTTIFDMGRAGIIPENVFDVLIDTHHAVQRDFILLLDIPLQQRMEFIVKLAQEIYLQWCEHGLLERKS
jgi:hypothetical protein